MRIFRIARAPPLLKTKDSNAASRSSRALADPSACARSRAVPMTERRVSGETSSRRTSCEISSTGRERRTDVAGERRWRFRDRGRRGVALFISIVTHASHSGRHRRATSRSSGAKGVSTVSSATESTNPWSATPSSSAYAFGRTWKIVGTSAPILLAGDNRGAQSFVTERVRQS